MTMGCGSSKKIVNESPSDCKVRTTLLPEGNASRESYSSGNKRNEKRKIPERTGQIWTRFHTRVTGKYDIKGMIGEGSFSKVVRVQDRATKQPYAIKMIEIEEGKDVFESELAVLRRVQHPYVVRLYEVLECKNKVYLVMELATGGELLERIVSRGYFTERDATHVLYMVLEGVRYLHSLGITHRDLKPENLLYYHPGNDSKIMITDFGLSNLKKGPDDSVMETTCGTPEYIAPEILLRRPYTNSVDMWSIGVISYILLSGGMPFADDNRTRLYRAILTAEYNYSDECHHLIMSWQELEAYGGFPVVDQAGNPININCIFVAYLWSVVNKHNIDLVKFPCYSCSNENYRDIDLTQKDRGRILVLHTGDHHGMMITFFFGNMKFVA